jgi:hypothetical protein
VARLGFLFEERLEGLSVPYANSSDVPEAGQNFNFFCKLTVDTILNSIITSF